MKVAPDDPELRSSDPRIFEYRNCLYLTSISHLAVAWSDDGGRTTRPDSWDEERIGAGAAPIKCDDGYLAIYHGCDRRGRYALGAVLLDPTDPGRVLARSAEPFMIPEAEYEKNGFYGNCVFTNGHILDGDRLTLFYGASDSVVCGAEL